jgi:hypothetical protein
MKTILILAFTFLSLLQSSVGQSFYAGVAGGIDLTGLRALSKPNNDESIELKIGWKSKKPKWQLESGYRQIYISDWDYPHVYYLGSVPVAVRYNLPFMFLQAGYASLLRKQDRIIADPLYYGIYYLQPSDALYYSPAVTAGFGLEKDISAQWKINMEVNALYSLESWSGYKDYRAAYFTDYAFQLGIDYYFIKH